MNIPKRTRAIASASALLLVMSLAFSGEAPFAPKTPGATPADGQGALGPLTTYLLPAAERLSFEGRVIEQLAAGSYLYLAVERADGTQSWVVTLGSTSKAQLDSRVRVVAVGYAEHFSSKLLARSFDGLYFAVVRSA